MEIITDAEVEELARARARALRYRQITGIDLDKLRQQLKLQSKIRKPYHGRSNKSIQNK